MRRSFSDGGTIFMNSTLVATINKNKLEEIRISVLRNNKIDIRTYFYFPGEKEPKPTKKGVWLSFKHIPPVIGFFEKLANAAADAKTPGAPLEFSNSEKEKIRVYASEYMGSTVVHIRTFYLRNNEYNPGKGVSFSMPQLPNVIEGLRQLDRYKDKV